MTESVKDSLNGALRTLIDDLMADCPIALATFEAWCVDHTGDIQLMALDDLLTSEWDRRRVQPPIAGNEG